MRALIIVGIVLGALLVLFLFFCAVGVALSCYYSIPYDEWRREFIAEEQKRQRKELRKRGRIKRWELWRKKYLSFWRSWKSKA